MASRIVVGYDGSDRSEDALALGRSLAEVMDARLIVAGVIHSNPVIVHFDPSYEEEDPELTDRVLRASTAVAGVAETIVGASAASGLHLLAEKERADLIVVGSSHRGPVGRVMVGSTAHRLLHGAPCPVAVAPVGWRGHANSGLRSIAVGYDGSPEAQVALDHAVELAKQEGAGIRIAMVAEPPPFVYGKGGWANQGYHELEKAIEEELRRQLQNAVAATSERGVEVEGELFSGDPAGKLAEVASKADLTIVGSRGYGPLRCVLLGSVSVALLDSCPSPVLVCARGSVQTDTMLDTRQVLSARG